MMTDFKVYCHYSKGWATYIIRSKVYAIDTIKDRFLLADEDGDFHWVDTEDCRLEEE